MAVFPVKWTPSQAALLLLLGCTARVEAGRTGEERVPAPVAQRVTATVEREASRLVRLSTEHEAFLCTPEHPFATARSGWIRAGRLAPGDWVISERLGAVRLLSVRSELAARPTPVFNLSVASGHAYFVGTDRVLVHNTKCDPNAAQAAEKIIEELTRLREQLLRQIEALTETSPGSPRIAELKLQRERLRKRIAGRRRAQREKYGSLFPSREARARQRHEADLEADSKVLEDARRELAELERPRPRSEAEESASALRKAELKREILALKRSSDRARHILTLLGELAELEQGSSATDADRRAREERKEKLIADIRLERKRGSAMKTVRKKRAAPEGRERSARYDRALRLRPFEQLELLENGLMHRYQEAPSESRDASIHHLTDQIDTMKKLVEVRKQARAVALVRRRLQRARERRIAEGRGTSDLDPKLEQTEREFHALRVQRAQLRVRERLLARLDETPWAHAPEIVDEERLREIERQLAESVAAGPEGDRQLTGIERALDLMDANNVELREAVLDEARDLDEVLGEREELLRQSPSPERAAGLESSYVRLGRELGEERAAVEGAVSALASEYASIETTQASSSSGSTWQERLRAIREEQGKLLAEWRAGLQARLDRTRGQLNLVRSLERFRDEEIELELARQIALLEHELQTIH